jgi:hypothetical protein
MRKISIILITAILVLSATLVHAKWVDFCDYWGANCCRGGYTEQTCKPPAVNNLNLSCTYFHSTQGCCCEGLVWAPDAPNVTATVEDNRITIQWELDPAAKTYGLWWGDSGTWDKLDDEHKLPLSDDSSSFVHENLEYNTTYYYYLTVRNEYGGSTATAHATTGSNPNPPTPQPQPSPGSAGALYRYFGNGEHFYTTNWNELGSGRGGYAYEGIQGYIYTNQQPGTVPLYRYFGNGEHFYTTNWNELGGGRGGYAYEGIQGYVNPTQQPGTVPLYRYFGNGDHFYTTNWSELGGGRGGYGYEGIQCYVSETPP